MANTFTSTYHLARNGQVERNNRIMLALLRAYVNDHQNDWEDCTQVLTYLYNNHVPRSTGMIPSNLMLSRPPPEFSLRHDIDHEAVPAPEQKGRLCHEH